MANVFLFADNAQTTLAAAIGTTATTLTVAGGSGALFPNPAAGQQFSITLNDTLTKLVFEVCYCTARTGDVLTIVRAQEGTVAAAWQIGDAIWCGPTGGQMSAMVQIPHMTDGSISPVFGPTIVEGTGTTLGALTVTDRNNNGAGAGIQLLGNGSVTPNKFMRAWNGSWQVVNNAYTAVLASLDDLGNFVATAGLWGASAHISGPLAAVTGNFTGAIAAASGAFTGAISAASAAISGVLTAASAFIGSATISAIYSNYLNAEGNPLFILSNAYTASVNAANNAYVEHYCAPASIGQAAVVLSQFAFSISGNGFITIPTNTNRTFYLQWGQVGVPAGVGDYGFAFPIAFPNAALAIVGSYQAAYPPLTGSLGFQIRDRASFLAISQATGGGVYGTQFFAVGY